MAEIKVKYEHKEYLNTTEISKMYGVSLLSVYKWLKESPDVLIKIKSQTHVAFKAHRNQIYHFEHLVDLRKSTSTTLINTIIELEDENRKLRNLLNMT